MLHISNQDQGATARAGAYALLHADAPLQSCLERSRRCAVGALGAVCAAVWLYDLGLWALTVAASLRPAA
jgi:hypothetical protein